METIREKKLVKKPFTGYCEKIEDPQTFQTEVINV